jgi:hypothetical protein
MQGCESDISHLDVPDLLPATLRLLVTLTFLKGREMRRTDLFERTMQGWARLNDRQRQRFAEGFLRAALRLERREFGEWLRRRVSEAPLAAPVDQASFAIFADRHC